MKLKFDEDIRTEVLSKLPYDPKLRAELERESSPDLLIIYLNWRLRFIDQRPRRVHRSAEIGANPLSSDAAYGPALEQLIKKIEAGENLTPHLSRAIRNGYAGSSVKRSSSPDRDLMLFDWDVHHLHLSNNLEADGFVTRDGPLLFAIFKLDDAYLIDLFPHRAWTRDHIFEVMIDNWPDVNIVRHMPTIVGLSSQPSEGDRAMLRAAGSTSPFVWYKGKCYFVGMGGVTSAGTALRCTMQANSILKRLHEFENALAASPTLVEDVMRAANVQLPASLDLHVVLSPDFFLHGFHLEERNSGFIFSLQ